MSADHIKIDTWRCLAQNLIDGLGLSGPVDPVTFNAFVSILRRDAPQLVTMDLNQKIEELTNAKT